MVIYKLMIGLAEWEPDAEKRYKHIVENMIYVCELQPKNMFLYMCAVDPFDTYKLNIYTGSFLEPEFDKHMKDVWGVDKFDVSLGNPPFKRKLNLKFLNKCMDISESNLFVHPSSWLIDEKNSNSDFRNARLLHSNSIKKVILFNGNYIFNIGLYIPSAITLIDKNHKVEDGIKVIDKLNEKELVYNSINDINKFSNIVEYKSILLKIKQKNSISDLYNKKLGNYYVNMSRIRGNVYMSENTNKIHKNDFYTTVTRDEKVEMDSKKSVFFSFNTELEANNFLKYLKTKFSRYCLSICKNSADLNKIDFSMIPLVDFNIEWTDSLLYDKFKISKEEIDFINYQIPEYYI